jgi:hypothetical protein
MARPVQADKYGYVKAKWPVWVADYRCLMLESPFVIRDNFPAGEPRRGKES